MGKNLEDLAKLQSKNMLWDVMMSNGAETESPILCVKKKGRRSNMFLTTFLGTW
jgi:hypothetical protein